MSTLTRSILIVTVAAIVAVAVSAQSYTVSSGDHTFSEIPSNHLNLERPYAGTVSANPISPAGFSFTYFGVNYTSFRVGAGGYIAMGTAGTPAGSPYHSTGSGLYLSPAMGDFDPWGVVMGFSAMAASGDTGWSFVNDVLTVQWADIPHNRDPAFAVRMQLVLDCATGVIEFRYGAPSYGALPYTSQDDNTVAISSASGTSQQIIPGMDFVPGVVDPNNPNPIPGSHVTSTGAINVYPANRYIRFTPAPLPELEVRRDDEAGTSLSHGSALDFGSALVGQTGASITVWVRNSGIADLTLGTPAIAGDGFVIDSSALPGTLAPGQAGTFSITFEPGMAGTVAGLASFTHNASHTPSPFELQLSGFGSNAGGGPAAGASSGSGGGGCVTDSGSGSALWLLLACVLAVGLSRRYRSLRS